MYNPFCIQEISSNDLTFPSFSQFQLVLYTHKFMPSPTSLPLNSQSRGNKERQNVAPSGIQTWHSAMGTWLCNHQPADPCCFAIVHLIIYLITV